MSQSESIDSPSLHKPTSDYWYTGEFCDTPLGKFITYRLIENRDCKIIITSHGSTTGTGKTTLAVILAKQIDRIAREVNNDLEPWNARDYSFLNVNEYLNQYKAAKPGRVLISDELETMVDNRRSISNANVYFTQAWQMLRYKNVITIGTAPGLHTLDKRVMQTADVWINVLAKGYAIPHYVSAHDFTGDPIYKRFTLDDRKTWIRWDKAEGDDYDYLSQKKKDLGIPGENKQIDEDDLKEEKRQTKMEITRNLIAENLRKDSPLSQEEMAEITGWSQPKISQIKRGIEEEKASG